MGLKKNQKKLLVIPKWGLDEFKLKHTFEIGNY
jgi:hypothetical protein